VVDLLAPASVKQEALLSRATPLVGVTWAANGATAAAGSVRPVTSITSVPSPAPVIAPESSPAVPNATSPQHGGIAERLRTLNELLAQGLISEKEYQELRRKILAEF